MSKVARDYLAALLIRIPRFGTVCYRGTPDGDRFDLAPEGEWVRYEDVQRLVDHLEDIEADEAPQPTLCASCSDTAEHYGHLSAAFDAIEDSMGLRDGLGSFHPRLRRIVAELELRIADYEQLANDAVRAQVVFRTKKRAGARDDATA